jgi:hypothetical protein
MKVLAELSFSILMVGLGLPGCQALAPEVGPFRGMCVGGDLYAVAPDAGASGGVDPRCAVEDEAGPCERCENEKCCTAKLACYDDSACSCADQMLDQCIEDIGGETAGDAPARLAECWADFSATGPNAKARADCQRDQCPAECEVPP